jgi:hypothetical protein
MKANTVILTLAMIIMTFYAFGGLWFMITTSTPYQPTLGASIIMAAAMIAASAGWIKTATT